MALPCMASDRAVEERVPVPASTLPAFPSLLSCSWGGTGVGKMLFVAVGCAVNEEVFLCILVMFLTGMFRQC